MDSIGSERSGATEARIAHHYTGRITGSARTTRPGYAETCNDVDRDREGGPPGQLPWMVCRSDTYTRQRLHMAGANSAAGIESGAG